MAFQKGNRLGELTRKPKEYKDMVDLVKEDALPLLVRIGSMSIDQLKLAFKDGNKSGLEADAISFLLHSIKKGDGRFTQLMLDRLLGKPKMDLGVTTNGDNSPIQVNILPFKDDDKEKPIDVVIT